MFDTLRAVAASHDAIVTAALINLRIASFFIALIWLILSFIPSLKGHKGVNGLFWFFVYLDILRWFGQWCAGL